MNPYHPVDFHIDSKIEIQILRAHVLPAPNILNKFTPIKFVPLIDKEDPVQMSKNIRNKVFLRQFCYLVFILVNVKGITLNVFILPLSELAINHCHVIASILVDRFIHRFDSIHMQIVITVNIHEVLAMSYFLSSISRCP